MERNAQGVVKAADKEISLCPNDAGAATNKLYALMDHNGDIAAAQQMLHQSPLKDHPDIASTIRLQIFMLQGKIDSAIQIIVTHPADTLLSQGFFYCRSFEFGYYYWIKGDIPLARKYFAQAVTFLKDVISKSPENANSFITTDAYGTLALSYAGLGDEKDCFNTFARLNELDLQRYDKRHQLDLMERTTTAYILLGKKDKAITNLGLLLQQPFNVMSTKVLYRLYPLYNSLRSDPGFQKLIQ